MKPDFAQYGFRHQENLIMAYIGGSQAHGAKIGATDGKSICGRRNRTLEKIATCASRWVSMPKTAAIVPVERIESRILLIRGHKVVLDSDLSELYGVSTKRLNEQVKRNKDRFPADFMFQLTSPSADGFTFSRVVVHDHKRI